MSEGVIAAAPLLQRRAPITCWPARGHPVIPTEVEESCGYALGSLRDLSASLDMTVVVAPTEVVIACRQNLSETPPQ